MHLSKAFLINYFVLLLEQLLDLDLDFELDLDLEFSFLESIYLSGNEPLIFSESFSMFLVKIGDYITFLTLILGARCYFFLFSAFSFLFVRSFLSLWGDRYMLSIAAIFSFDLDLLFYFFWTDQVCFDFMIRCNINAQKNYHWFFEMKLQ